MYRRCNIKHYKQNSTKSVMSKRAFKNMKKTSMEFQVVFHESGWAWQGYQIAKSLHISSDRKEVTCSVGGQCGDCGPQGGDILLKAEGFLFLQAYHTIITTTTPISPLEILIA